MDYRVLLAAAVLFVILLLILYVMLYVSFRQLKLDCSCREKSMLEQLSRIEKQYKEAVELSSLYDQSSNNFKNRTEFFTNITHELKTPLSVILGAIQLMEKKRSAQADEDGTGSQNLRIIRVNCYRMLRLVNNLLDLTKMEAGYLSLNPVNCDLDILLEEIVRSVTPYAVQKQLELIYVKSSVPIVTAVDIEKMERILLNLLSNSIKFTKPGGTINVSVKIADGRVCISVKDTGVGIPAEMQAEVFERYRQAGSYPSLENGGSGIGLSLVRSFVSLHQGDIRVASEKGRGCEFIIDLPLSRVSEPSPVVNGSVSDPVMDDYSFMIREAANIEFADLRPIAS